MILELRHDVMGGFGKTYVEERTTCTDDETVKIALATFRKDRDCVLWIEEFGDASDGGSLTGVCVSWETVEHYENKWATVTKYYGAGNISDQITEEWTKVRSYIKRLIKTEHFIQYGRELYK